MRSEAISPFRSPKAGSSGDRRAAEAGFRKQVRLRADVCTWDRGTGRPARAISVGPTSISRTWPATRRPAATRFG